MMFIMLIGKFTQAYNRDHRAMLYLPLPLTHSHVQLPHNEHEQSTVVVPSSVRCTTARTVAIHDEHEQSVKLLQPGLLGTESL